MNKLYKVAQKLGNKFIPQYGVEITFTQRNEASFDPILGQKTSNTVVFTGFGVKSDYNQNEIDGTIVKSGDVKILLENTETIPKIGDDAAVNGSGTFRIMDVNLTSPAEETIIYTLQLRK